MPRGLAFLERQVDSKRGQRLLECAEKPLRSSGIVAVALQFVDDDALPAYPLLDFFDARAHLVDARVRSQCALGGIQTGSQREGEHDDKPGDTRGEVAARAFPRKRAATGAGNAICPTSPRRSPDARTRGTLHNGFHP